MSDPNRLSRTKEELKDVGLLNKVKVFTFEPDNEDRIRGCYTSHISVLSQVSKRTKKDAVIMVLEDNLEITNRFDPRIVQNIKEFIQEKQKSQSWDIFHLAYMMYVPNLSMSKVSFKDESIVKLNSDKDAALGTTAYLVSASGAQKLLQWHATNGYAQPIPNVISTLFAENRYAAYPMLFHRAAKVASLVNPKLDDFRKLMFNPFIYSTWERLMYSTGLVTNNLFQGVCVTLVVVIGAGGMTMYNLINQ